LRLLIQQLHGGNVPVLGESRHHLVIRLVCWSEAERLHFPERV
jgi:hypothetical protein